jgi:hypothetical protein
LQEAEQEIGAFCRRGRKEMRTDTRPVASVLMAALLLAGTIVVVYAKGNGRLKPGVDFSGPHFNLNIHGVPYGVDKFKDDSVGSSRHSIFVPLSPDEGPVEFDLEYAFSYDSNWTVLDCDATGDGYASIILPAYMYLDTDGDGEEEKKQVSYYMVYLVGLGKPADDSVVVIEPEATYNESWTAFQLNQDKLEVTGKRKKNQPLWFNGTELFFADVKFCYDPDSLYPVCTEYFDTWIFDIPGLEGYWWKMTNNDVKLMQVRFYPVFK